MLSMFSKPRADAVTVDRNAQYNEYQALAQAAFRADESGGLVALSRDTTAPVSNVVQLRKPQPITPVIAPKADFSEYEALAEQLGFQPTAIAETRRKETRDEVVSFLLDNGLPYYDTAEVKAYMDALVKKENQGRDQYEPRIHWHWVSIEKHTQAELDAYRKAEDQAQLARATNPQGFGFRPSLRQVYSKAIPINMLKRALKIKQQFKDATFEVTDYYSINPDPFICVRVNGCEPVIFGVWDEPGFKAVGDDA